MTVPHIKNAPMSAYTSFRTGGSADLLLLPRDPGELARCVAENPGAAVIGGGTNLLVADAGIRGTVIRAFDPCSKIYLDDGLVAAEAGARLSAVCSFAHSNGRTGLEFAGGIPGTVGGGVMMNAGAYGGELKDVIIDCDAVLPDGRRATLTRQELALSYRHSALAEMGAVVLRARFALPEGDPEAGRALLRELNARRREKQPLEFPSAGSTFKRPQGYFAGALIEKAGLKGRRIGGAMVSEKHAGFIVNAGGATSADIFRLIRTVQKEVFESAGVRLETEVRMMGDFDALGQLF